MADDATRLTVRMTSDARKAVEKIAEMTGATIADVIRRAIGTELYLLEQKQRGARILIEDRDGKTRELVLR